MLKYFSGYTPATLDPHKGILLCGEKGIGKTVLMLAMRRMLPESRQFGFMRAETMGELYREKGHDVFNCLNRAFMINDIVREKDFYTRFGEPLNVIQFALDTMYDNWQYKGIKPFATTNGTRTEFEKKYDLRTTGCMLEMFNVVWIYGKNLRPEK